MESASNPIPAHTELNPPLTLKTQDGILVLSKPGKAPIDLHPLWIRERMEGPDNLDPISHQRLYEHAKFPSNLKVVNAQMTDTSTLRLQFSDGYGSEINLQTLEREIGWRDNPEALPLPKSWNTSHNVQSETDWSEIDNPEILKERLKRFLTYGFCIFQNTPTERDELVKLAGRFGYVRDTNFGQIFNVETKPKATDAAYTDLALASHTDNPYRDPVPGIQFLHCLRNEVSGGLSTLVDGIAIVEQLHKEAPEQVEVLERVNVRYRYHGPSAILEHHGPIIERDYRGIVRRIRQSSRVDYVPALDKHTLDLFYAGRKRLHELSNSPQFKIQFPFKPGTLLMMDNYRLLHGRTAFNGKQGHRHLQGCYIDHDGVSSLYRLLALGDKNTYVARET